MIDFERGDDERVVLEQDAWFSCRLWEKQHVVLKERSMRHGVVEALSRCGEIDVDIVRAFVEAEALDDAGQAEAVVAVEMRDCDMRDLRGADVCVSHLSLCAFAGVEEYAVIVPFEEIAVVISLACRHLRGSAKYDEFSCGHISIVKSAVSPIGDAGKGVEVFEGDGFEAVLWISLCVGGLCVLCVRECLFWQIVLSQSCCWQSDASEHALEECAAFHSEVSTAHVASLPMRMGALTARNVLSISESGLARGGRMI